MSTMLEAQNLLYDEISKLYISYKKDGAERKNHPEYFKRQYNKLEELWQEFQFNHDRLAMETSQTDPYFMEKMYEKTKETYLNIKKRIQADYEQIIGSGEKPGPSKIVEQPIPERQTVGQVRGTYSKLDENLRKQETNFRAFSRTITNIDIDSLTDKWEYEDALKAIESRWSVIDLLH